MCQERRNLNLSILSPEDQFEKWVLFYVLLLEETKNHYQNDGLLLIFLSSSKILPLVIAYRNLTRRHLEGKIILNFEC